MKKLEITKGEVSIRETRNDADFSYEIIVGTDSVCYIPRDYGSLINQKANSELISDTFTTYNIEPTLPSELLKQRNELLEMLNCLIEQENLSQSAHDCVCDLIQKTTTE
jgi:CRISPR/Cas system-associated exonuclease Cas4 (RecB family)